MSFTSETWNWGWVVPGHTGLEGIDSQAETIQVSFVAPGSSLQVCCLQGLFQMVAVLSAASPQSAQADDWLGLYGLLCFWLLTSQVDTRSRSTNSVQSVQLRVVPGLRRYSTFTRGLNQVVNNFDRLDYYQ